MSAVLQYSLLIFIWVGFRWDGHYGPEMGGMDPNPPIEMRVPPMPTRSWHPKKTSTTADLSTQTVPLTPFCQRLTSRRWQPQKTSSTVGSSTQDICSAFLLISWMRNNRNFTDWKTTAAGGTWRCLLKTAKRSASQNTSPNPCNNQLGAVYILHNRGWGRGGLPDLLQYYIGGWA